MSDSQVLLHQDATLEPGEGEGSDDLYRWALQLLLEIHERALRLTRGVSTTWRAQLGPPRLIARSRAR